MPRLITIVLACLMLIFLVIKTNYKNEFLRFPKIRGVSLKVSRNVLDSLSFYRIKNAGAKYVSITPYALANKGSSKLGYDLSWQFWGEKSFGVVRSIELAKKQSLKVMLRPKVWIMNGYSVNMDFPEQKLWDKWLKHYRKYILHYAQLAEEFNVDAFCLGNELKVCVNKNRHFWRALIEDVRSVYHGKITYAAKLSQVQNFPLWESLDFIGVNVKLPFSEKLNPTKIQIKSEWRQVIDKLQEVSNVNNRPIVFTELTYSSKDAVMPESLDYPDDFRIQRMNLELFFEEVWARPWMKGVFLWDWGYSENPKIKDYHFP